MVEYTEKQGPYLTYLYHYTKLMGQPPAEADMQRYFGVSAPTVHQMILTLATVPGNVLKRAPQPKTRASQV